MAEYGSSYLTFSNDRDCTRALAQVATILFGYMVPGTLLLLELLYLPTVYSLPDLHKDYQYVTATKLSLLNEIFI